MRGARTHLLFNARLQMLLVLVIIIAANLWSTHRFFRIDLTSQNVHSLDSATRNLVAKLEKPLVAKVYFTGQLQAPYNNHEQAVVDMLHELAAYSHGRMRIEVVDPTGNAEAMATARQFGIQPIDYRYRTDGLSELRKIVMGVAFIHGEKQASLPAITQLQNLEYDIAKTLKALVSDEPRKVIGYTVGHGEPDLGKARGPLEEILSGLSERYTVTPVRLGDRSAIPDEVDALWVVGPQKQLSDRALYHLDQFLMRGGALGMFVTNVRGDMKTGRPRAVRHGMDEWLQHMGVTVHRDTIIDRKRNGVVRMPVRQGRYVLQMPVNFALIPRVSNLNTSHPAIGPTHALLFPYASSLDIAEKEDVESTVLGRASASATRMVGIPTVAPRAFNQEFEGEEAGGEWPVLVSMVGRWDSFYAESGIPEPDRPGIDTSEDDPSAHRRQSDPARLVISGSADFVANNVPFMLNLADWMLQDASLIRIRSKNVAPAPLEALNDDQATIIRAVNLLGGALFLLMFGLARRAFRPKPPKIQTTADSVLEMVDQHRRRMPFHDDDTDEKPALSKEPGLPGPTFSENNKFAMGSEPEAEVEVEAEAEAEPEAEAEVEPKAEAEAEAEPEPEAEAEAEPEAEAEAEAEPEPEPEPLPSNWSLADEILESDEEEEISPEQRAESMRLGRTARQILEEQNKTGEIEPSITLPDPPEDDPTEEVQGAEQMKVLSALAKPIEDVEPAEDPETEPPKKRPKAKRKTKSKRTTWTRKGTAKKKKGSKPKGGDE